MYLMDFKDPLETTYLMAHVKEVPRAEEDLREPSQAGCVRFTVIIQLAIFLAN